MARARSENGEMEDAPRDDILNIKAEKREKGTAVTHEQGGGDSSV